MASSRFISRSFVLSTDASGTQDITISGAGASDEFIACLIFATATVTANDTVTAEHGLSIGWTDGTNQYVQVGFSEDGSANTDTRRAQRTDSIIHVINEAGAVQHQFSFDSFITDGVRLTIDNQAAAAYKFTLVLVRGSPGSVAIAGTFDDLGSGTSAIPIDITGVNPNIIFTGCTGNNASLPNNGVHLIQSFGIWINDGADTQKCLNFGLNDGSATAQSTSYLSTNDSMGQTLSGIRPWGGTIDNVSDGNFDVTPSADAGSDIFGYLAIELADDPEIALFDTVIPTSGDYTEEGASFSNPVDFGMQISVEGIGTRDTVDLAATLGVSFATFGASNIEVLCVTTQDAATNTVEKTIHNNVLFKTYNSTATVDVEFSALTLNAAGWIGTSTTTPTDPLLGFALALSEASSGTAITATLDTLTITDFNAVVTAQTDTEITATLDTLTITDFPATVTAVAADIDHYVSVGLATTAQVKCRVSSGDDTTLEYSVNSNFTSSTITAAETPVSGDDFNVTFNLTGLSANTQYYYRAIEDGLTDVNSGKFKTMQIAGTPHNFTFAFSGDAELGNNSTAFDNVDDKDPDFFIHMGDMHYAEETTATDEAFRENYRTVFAQSRQQTLYRNRSLMYVWDDNDFGVNDSDGSSATKLNAATAYRDFFPTNTLENPTSGTIQQTWTNGRVKFISLDTRYEKNAPTTMLGSAQETWLDAELEDSAAGLADGSIILTVVNVTTVWISTLSDSWNGNSTSRTALSDKIWLEGLENNIVFIAADSHHIGHDDGTNNDFDSSSRTGWPLYHSASLGRDGIVSGGPYSGASLAADTDNSTGQYSTMQIVDDGNITITVRGFRENNTEFYNDSITVLDNTAITASLDSLNITDFNATIILGEDTNITATFDTLSITDFNTNVTALVNTNITASLDTLSITDFNAIITIEASTNIAATVDNLVITDFNTIVVGLSDLLINATTDTLTITDFKTTVLSGAKIWIDIPVTDATWIDGIPQTTTWIDQ